MSSPVRGKSSIELFTATLYLIYSPGYQYNFAPGLPSDEQDEVLDHLDEAVAAAKERERIKAEEEYWEAVEEEKTTV